ncbi:hypothetical protein CI109_101821 [Kwoniella shandongensis]|uniref:Uncharacterized protein n=1 Tax=Kwoniella shandongensis TaxID=1734106 RepID=A0A5M6C530_9TREE|nr:uncharacterized protein CI109_001057 [Kwoniella shandongensis]KAA5530257.1 hypothetical protein CI109_001057 [Kwoniella shandongensis]
MEVTPEQLAGKIVKAYRVLPPDKRLLVAIAGPPGSGKSTLAYPLTDALNTLLLHHTPPNPSQIENPPSLDLVEASGTQGKDDEVAICVGLDGWHHSRKELDGFDDPTEAHWRRGAAFTFDLPSYHTFLSLLRLPIDPHASTPLGIPFPTFSHSTKDPQPSPYPILSRHRIILIEGLYTLLDQVGWKECAEMMDVKVYVDVDEEEARGRVVRRNFEAGIVDSIEKCEERVDAVDMVNGEQVRNHLVSPTYIIKSTEGQPFSAKAFQA